MNKKVLAALVATMAVGATTAFAANPFVDVPSDSWAYKSVVELADAGIIQGVDGQYFQGERNITRYEAAEMVAKAMAHQDKATVEQRALINKLADEYADELNNLGVRVSALENKVGNVKLSGDARIRYMYQDNKDSKKAIDNDASWSYRVRLRANAQVNDKIAVTYGLSTNNQNFSNNNAASAADPDIYTYIAKVDAQLGKDWTASVGRTDAYVMGNAYGYNYGDVFDRAELKYNNGQVAVTAGYGKFKEGADYFIGTTIGPDTLIGPGTLDGVKTGYGELEYFFGNGSAVGVYYNSFSRAGGSGTQEVNDFAEKYIDADNLWGAYASVNFGEKWNLLANYEKISKDNTYSLNYHDGTKVNDPEVWIGQLKYGNASMATPKSWDIWVEYIDAEDGAFLGGSTNSWRFDSRMDNLTSWGAGIDYTIAKNTMFSVMQSFGSSMKDGDQADPEEQTKAQLVFAF